MQGSKEYKKQRLQLRGCRALCCSCRLSVSSSEGAESSNSERFAPISSLAHAMVQERLEQMIRERQGARHEERKKARVGGTKFIVMMAMEKSSYDPREDFRESMVEMIMANRIEEPKDLRGLLNCYVSMNSDEYRGLYLRFFTRDGEGSIKRVPTSNRFHLSNLRLIGVNGEALSMGIFMLEQLTSHPRWVPQIEKYRSEFVIAKMVIGKNAIEYITIFVHLSLLCIIRTIVAANAATIIAED
ncbi:uncharacterized protein LOC117923236 [Vitis riparia]|uniref:uncharacterized protein LOC117923236 n=1 Tax=Vitis riparia TaxID=96939 RepID=UPI00155AF0A9|nr:uncharacterized protein LOC117923236 [Vitis riparia]